VFNPAPPLETEQEYGEIAFQGCPASEGISFTGWKNFLSFPFRSGHLFVNEPKALMD